MWLNRIIAAACEKLALKFDAVYEPNDFNGDLKAYTKARDIDFVSFGNADLTYTGNLDEHLGFHIVRDPRDIVVSAYFSHLKSHSTGKWPALIEYRKKLQSVSRKEGLMLEIENRAEEFQHMSNWDYEQDHILELRFEDVVLNSYENLIRVFDHLQLLDERDYRWLERARTLALELVDFISPNPASRFSKAIKPKTLSGAEILVITWRNRFQAQTSGRKPGEEKLSSHYRKGQPGDWRNHFTREHKQLFAELYPSLLADLGYEDTDDWQYSD